MRKELETALRGELKEYRSIPFWSWNNSLDEGELTKQIEEMKTAGIGGFIMHARTGLKDEYLGERWFSCIEACLKKARELDMEAWVYDENGWPSGFCGGKLLEDESFRARFLECRSGDFDETAFASFVRDDEKGFVRVTEKRSGTREYKNVYLCVSPANTDILDPRVVDAFIASTHEKYYERFGEYFGKELVGFFTDEPQFYRWATPYTPVAEAEFAEAGEDIRDGLIWLFDRDERGYEFREKYYATLNKLYTENFYGKIYNWCHDHGCLLTGHSIEEGSLGGQMMGGAAIMPSYEYEDVPAVDWLGRFCGNDLSPKQVSSVAAQFGKKRILTETFACSGYDVTPYELKSIAEFQYFAGVNVTCQHLYPYSVAGRGRIDHPPVFGPKSNWNEGFRAFNDYFARLSYIISNTDENPTIGVINPVRDIWLDYTKENELLSVKETEDTFNAFMTELRASGLAYDFIDERILARHGEVRGDKLGIEKREYGIVILPQMRNISSSTYRILKDYRGKLCTFSVPEFKDGKRAKVSLEGNVTFDEIVRGRKIKFSCPDHRSTMYARSGKIGDFILVKNSSYYEQSTVKIEGAQSAYRALDLETLTESDVTDEFVLPPGGSIILIADTDAKRASGNRREEDVTEKFRVDNITENYFVMDYAELSRGGEFGEKRAIPGLFEDLLREDFNGKITVRQRFTLAEKMPLTLVVERADFISAEVNGVPVSFVPGNFDVNFVEADITPAVKKGDNVFEYSLHFHQHDGVHFALFDPLATESVRNCLYYDTSIENTYLRGDFVVGEDFSLSPRKNLPPVVDDLYKRGYPFFKGELTLTGKVTKPETGRVFLRPSGRFMTAEIAANGKKKLFVFGSDCDITDVLHVGENDVSIAVRSSMRNLFGPHHYAPEPEPMAVSPFNFEFRGGWENGGKPDAYTDDYNFVPFGVKKITVVTETK